MQIGRIPRGEGPSRDQDSFDFSGMRQRLTPRVRRARSQRAGTLATNQKIGIAVAAGYVVLPLLASRRRRRSSRPGT